MKSIKLLFIILILNSCSSENSQNKDAEITRSKKVEEALNNLKEDNIKTAKINEAISLADKAMESGNDSRKEAYYSLAIEKFGEANYICEKYATCYFGRAGIYLGLKNFESACSDFNQFLSIYENNPSIHSPIMEDLNFKAKSTIEKFCTKSEE
jgi:tetratricopeptide (TPR) repeat protein